MRIQKSRGRKYGERRISMKKLILNEKDYLEKVNGGWMGKNIGGTLGGPVEGKMEVLDLKFYPNLTQVPLPNDDLDLQLVWLHALEQYGARLDAARLGQEWVDHVFSPMMNMDML